MEVDFVVQGGEEVTSGSGAGCDGCCEARTSA